MAWVNIPASLSLRDELNAAFPGRDKASDGFVGDTSHAASSSDHNPDETGNAPYSDADSIDEVHAYDADSDLRTAGWSMERVVQTILARCRAGAEKRIRYIIYNRRIWSATVGWVQRDYTGSSPHTEHAHFSFYYGSGSGTSNPENITSPWGVLAAKEAEMALDAADVKTMFVTDNVIEGPSMAASVMDGTNPYWTAGGFLRDIANYNRINEDKIEALTAKVDALAVLVGRIVAPKA